MLNVEIICERRLDEGVHAGGVAGQTLLLNRKLFVSADWTKVSMRYRYDPALHNPAPHYPALHNPALHNPAL
jgi:hypothetical protein